MFTVKAFENQCRNAITSCSFSVRVTSHGGSGGGEEGGSPWALKPLLYPKLRLKYIVLQCLQLDIDILISQETDDPVRVQIPLLGLCLVY